MHDLIEKIRSRRAIISIVGCGVVGSRVRDALRLLGFQVHCIDTDPSRGGGPDPIRTSDCVILCLPTPMMGDRVNLVPIKQAITTIAPLLKPYTLVSLESTSYPGTTQGVSAMISVIRPDLTLGEDLFVGFAPERIDPGNKSWDLANTPRLVSGCTPQCLTVMQEIYQLISPIISVSSPAVAEAAKLLENSQRAVGIAFANEFETILLAMRIDADEVFRAAASKPFGYLDFRPGIGVGGHCIAVDPGYMLHAAAEAGSSMPILDLSFRSNRDRPDQIADRIRAEIGDGKKIYLWGVAYKPGVDDVRESPALRIIERLQRGGSTCCYYDPYVPSVQTTFGELVSQPPDTGTCASVDAIVVLTRHGEWTVKPWTASR